MSERMQSVSILGAGVMGTYLAQAFAGRADITVYDAKGRAYVEMKGLTVRIAESAQDAVRNADIVMYCVPADEVGTLMRHTLPACKPGAVISGQTSRKALEAVPFDEYMSSNGKSALEMVTIHTMCNPVLANPKNAILGIIRHKASEATYARAHTFFAPLSDRISEFTSVKEHDTATAHTQINTSRTLLSIASGFAQACCYPDRQKQYASALDRIKFALAMRASSLSSHVYRGIQFGSPEGKELVKVALEVEHELYHLIVTGERDTYKRKCIEARKFICGERRGSLLREEKLAEFGDIDSIGKNSHLSIMQLAVTYHRLKRGFFGDLKATTPMHTSLLIMTDYLFTSHAFEEALEAPFESSVLRGTDLIFDREITGWSEAILHENREGYDARHRQMNNLLADEVRLPAVELSKRVQEVCDEALLTKR